MYRKTVLENGIRVVTERMPDVRSLTIGLVLDVGSKDETLANNGIAHCIEHMLFKGTSGRDAAALARLIDLAGGQMGAFTTRDYTCLYAAVLDDYRTYALDIFGDILLHSLFDAEGLHREQEAILQELEAGDEKPDKLAQTTLKQLAWFGHALGQPIFGRRNIVANLTRPEVLSFFQQHYVADKLIVSAAGNVEHDDFVTQVYDALWALPSSSAGGLIDLSKPKISPPSFQGGVELRLRESAHIYFSLGAPAPKYADESRYAVYVLNNLLGGGMSSRLYQTVRDERGWVYEIGSNYHPYRDAGMMLVEGFTTPSNFLLVMSAVVDQLINLQSEPVTEEELWRAKERLRGEILIGAEASNARMSQLATQELYFGRFLSLRELVEGIRGVTSADIMQAVESIFQPGELALSAVGNFNQVEQEADQLKGLLGLS
jgi:predicted Zn-dependent peptidase